MSAGLSPHDFSAAGTRRQSELGSRRYDSDATILLVGFIGAGKKTLGFIASAALRRRFIDFEAFFQGRVQSSPQEFAATHGFARYRELEVEICQEIIAKHRTGCVVAGLGVTASLPRPGVWDTLTQQHPVIYVRRNKADLQQLIGGDPARFERIFEIGNAFYESISNFDFFNLTQEVTRRGGNTVHASLKLKEIERVFVAFLLRIFGKPKQQLFSVDAFSEAHTYALHLSLSDLEERDDLDDLDTGADAINLLLVYEDYSHERIMERLSRHMTILRTHTRVPIIIDAKADPQKTLTSYYTFLENLQRVAPDAFTISIATNPLIIKEIHSTKSHPRMIVVHDQSGPLGLETPDTLISSIRSLLQQLKPEALRLAGKRATHEDTLSCVAFRQKLRDDLNIPVIAYNECSEGRASMILNPTLSPLTIYSNSNVALSMQQAQQALSSLSLQPKKSFMIVGQDVRLKIQNVSHVEDILKHPSIDSALDGIAISLPFKTEVLRLLDVVSPDARDINAVNTVVLKHRTDSNGVKTRFYHGHNTDYVGIKDCVYSHLSPANAIRDGSTALIIGAGGMARAAIYACYQLGVRRIFVYNRTSSNAQSLVQYYRDWARSKGDYDLHLDVIECVDAAWPPDFRLPTIVVSCIPGRHPDTHSPVEFRISDKWLESRTGGVYVEVGYGPFKTVLMEQLTPWSSKGWVIVDGLKVLVGQGIAQYELFTRRPAPVHIMRRAVQEEAFKNGYFCMC
ncbi:hypothetical protein N7452_004449 [Penicillium brevicompactum]|uniref:Quinate repressor protein n=1 Tax=Penicillium brevicompactum TaxID=5074 RepID=A0A9W9QGZ0_PENBR|nr:hypothetical protein N7452_004449 [Penicillium brevicompactum]